MKETLLVQTILGEKKHSQIWEDKTPVPIGRPFRWVIERTDAGIRIRDMVKGSYQKVTDEEINSGARIELDGAKVGGAAPAVILRRAVPIPPAYLTGNETERDASGNMLPMLFAYAGVRRTIVSCTPVHSAYVAYERGKPAFTLYHGTETLRIKTLTKVRLKYKGETPIPGPAGTTWEIPYQDLGRVTIFKGWHWWRLNLVQTPAALASQVIAADGEGRFFRNMAIAAIVAFFAIMAAILFLVPAQKDEPEPEAPIVKLEKRPKLFSTLGPKPPIEKKSDGQKVAGPKAEKIAAGEEAAKAESPKSAPAAVESAPKHNTPKPPKDVAQAPTPPKHQMLPKLVAQDAKPVTASMAPKSQVAPVKPSTLVTSKNGTVAKSVQAKKPDPNEAAARAALEKARNLKAALSGFKASMPEGLVKGESNGKASSDEMFQAPAGAGGVGMAPSAVRPLISGGGFKVEGIGGRGGSGGGQGYGVGGVRGSVGGQGGSFVSMGEGGGFKADEGLTKEEVGAVIYSHMGEVRYCHESAMLQNPKTEGKLVIQFRIDPHGRVETAAVESTSVTPGTLDECVRSRLMTWRFPKPRGGVHVTVSYPFLFKTLERE